LLPSHTEAVTKFTSHFQSINVTLLRMRAKGHPDFLKVENYSLPAASRCYVGYTEHRHRLCFVLGTSAFKSTYLAGTLLAYSLAHIYTVKHIHPLK